MEQIYGSISETAQMFGLKPALIRQYCHAKGQTFASQRVEKGKIRIHFKKFEQWLTMRRPEQLRRI